LVLALIALIAGGCINNPGATPSASQNASPEPSGAAAITLTCDDFPSSGTISPVATLATGVVLTITMCDVGSDGGYQWADPVYDPRALALVGEDSIAPPGQPGLVGASGSSVWRFQALAVESSTITFADRRVWEKGVPPFLSVVVSVKATPSSSFTPLPVITPAATAIPAPLLTPSPASTPAVSEGQPPAEPAGFTAYQHAVTVQCPSPNANSHLRWQTDLAWHSSVDAATWFRVNEGWTGEGPGDITCPTTPIIPILPANSWYWGRPQGPEAPPWSPPSTSVAAHPAVG
jgi:predicted secreted protein